MSSSVKIFAAALVAAFISPAVPASDGEKPLWTAGLMTDTHIGETDESCARVKAACELLDDLGVDLVVNCGDIAERFTVRGYRILRRIYDRAFKNKKPREIWVYANHEHVGRKNEPFEKVMAEVRELLRIPHGLYETVDLKGYPLVVLPQWLDRAKAEDMLADAASRYPGKPIFVFDHVPARGTTFNSTTWGGAGRYELFAKFPQVIHFSGHVHGSLRDERQIWQGDFTALNLGCLAGWTGSAVGGSPANKSEYMVLFMEVYASRIVLRRFDIRDRSEHRASSPWVVPLPFDAASAPCRPEKAAAREPVPAFPADARISLAPDASPAESVKVSFAPPPGVDGVYKYKIEVLDEKGALVARQDEFGPFWMRPADRPEKFECKLSAAYFDSGCRRTVSVTPMNCFGVAGRPVKGEITLGAVAGELVWESVNPSKDCVFRRRLEGGEIKKAIDGWFEMHPADNRLEFPKGVWDGPDGTRFRFTVDLETETFTDRPWTIVLRNPSPVANANPRVYTAAGKTPKHRLVIEFVKKKASYNYYLLVREGGAGRIRFHRVRIEKLK